MKPLWIELGAVACAFAMSLAGCGSAPDAGVFGQAGGSDSGTGGGDTSTGGNDTGSAGDTHGGPKDTSGGPDTTPPPEDTTPPPVDAPPPTTLDNVCERLAAVICTSATSSCCSSKGIPYDGGGCRAGVMASCGAAVDAVKAGTMTFDVSSFDACASAWVAAESKCSIPILDFVRGYAPCDQLFNGMTAPGDFCSTSTDCHADGGGFVQCSTNSSTCTEFFIVGKDASCNYDGSTIHLCDYGLYCSSATGTCRTAKSPGSGCTGSDVTCGFGNTCDAGHCAPGAAAGASCYDNLSCASWNCSTTTLTCTDPNYELATSSTCSGT